MHNYKMSGMNDKNFSIDVKCKNLYLALSFDLWKDCCVVCFSYDYFKLPTVYNVIKSISTSTIKVIYTHELLLFSNINLKWTILYDKYFYFLYC